MPEDFDRFAERYDALLRQSLGGLGGDPDYYRRRKAVLARALCPGRAEAVLEYGCGTGGNLAHLARVFPQARLSGCDVSEKSLALAGEAFPDAALYLLGRDPLPRAAFDLVFVAGVLHHVPPADRPGVFAAMAAALAPGGRLALFEHNPANPLTRKVVARCPFDADAVLLPPAEAMALAVGAGLVRPVRRYVSFFPPSLAGLAPLEALLGWLPLGGQYLLTAERPS